MADAKKSNKKKFQDKGDVIDMLLQASGDVGRYHEPEVVFEGQLAIDMAETDDALVVISTIAGVDPKNIEIHIEGDTLTIRGTRESSFKGSMHDYFYKECYWGVFSRSIVLPVEVRGEEAEAEFHNGLLTITIPKIISKKSIPIHIVDEE